MRVTAEDLNEVMEFDHVIRVEADGMVRDTMYTSTPVYAPDVEEDPDGDVRVSGEGWTCLTGFTGQYSYSGAVMHASEYVGGALAEHILSTPGYYAVVEVRNEIGEYPDGDPVGWAVVTRELEES